MRKIILIIMALCTLSGCKCENSTISADSLLDFVDPLIGTGGHGHTSLFLLPVSVIEWNMEV